MKVRKYKFVIQGRNSEDEDWKNVNSDYVDRYLALDNHLYFSIRDGGGIPKEAFNVSYPGVTATPYMRDTLQAVGDKKETIILVVRDYPKMDPDNRVDVNTGKGWAVAICNECSERIPPGQMGNHLRITHDKRLKNLTKPIQDYFTVTVEH